MKKLIAVAAIVPVIAGCSSVAEVELDAVGDIRGTAHATTKERAVSEAYDLMVKTCEKAGAELALPTRPKPSVSTSQQPGYEPYGVDPTKWIEGGLKVVEKIGEQVRRYGVTLHGECRR